MYTEDDLDWTMEDLNAEELNLLTSVIDEDEPSNSLQSVSHDPAKERDPAVKRPAPCLEGLPSSKKPRPVEVRLWLG